MFLAEKGLMRIRVIQKPLAASVDGIRLDLFEVGSQYDVGTTLGTLALAEGWAEPVANDKPALVIPLDEMRTDDRTRPSQRPRHRALGPPDRLHSMAADTAPRKRNRRRR
jgi:hypothetical protein